MANSNYNFNFKYIKLDIPRKERRLKQARYQIYFNKEKLDITYRTPDGEWYIEISEGYIRGPYSTRRTAACVSYWKLT